MLKYLRNLILKIRTKEDVVKRRYLFIFSGISMILVISMWIIFANFTIQPVGFVSEKDSDLKTQGFAEIMKTGFGVFAKQVKNSGVSAVNFLKSKIKSENQIIINNPNKNFIVE